jgi:hypothetical protein
LGCETILRALAPTLAGIRSKDCKEAVHVEVWLVKYFPTIWPLLLMPNAEVPPATLAKGSSGVM